MTSLWCPATVLFKVLVMRGAGTRLHIRSTTQMSIRPNSNPSGCPLHGEWESDQLSYSSRWTESRGSWRARMSFGRRTGPTCRSWFDGAEATTRFGRSFRHTRLSSVAR